MGETAEEATNTAKAIVGLRDEHRVAIGEAGLGVNGLRLVDLLFERPLANVNLVRDRLDVSFVTANKLVDRMAGLGLLEEITGGRRNRVFRYTPYLALFTDDAPPGDETTLQSTETGRSLGGRRRYGVGHGWHQGRLACTDSTSLTGCAFTESTTRRSRNPGGRGAAAASVIALGR